MKIKREGDDWSWINFKYERLSTFCFVCGILGHSERECNIMYANPDKVMDRAYGPWLRASTKNAGMNDGCVMVMMKPRYGQTGVLSWIRRTLLRVRVVENRKRNSWKLMELYVRLVPIMMHSVSEGCDNLFSIFLFETDASTQYAFIIDGFRSWKRVQDNKKYFFWYMLEPQIHHIVRQ